MTDAPGPSAPQGIPAVGESVGRVEDARFVTGQARYIDNLPVDGCLRAVFVRSPIGHARLPPPDVAEAAAMPGVAGVWAAEDLGVGEVPAPSGADGLGRPVLARDTVRFVGEAVAVVVAESLAAAEDAAEAVWADYEPLPVVTDPERALDDDAPLLFPERGTNLVKDDAEEDAGALDDAEVVVSGRFVNQRVAPVPLEANAVLCVPEDGGERLAVWVSSQSPFRVRDQLAAAVGLDPDAVRVVAPDVGGGFGAKLVFYPEYVAVAAAALRLGRPVRWVETRSESMTAMAHGRAHVQRVEVGATRQGVITGLRIDLLADCGAYPTIAGVGMPRNTHFMSSGAYRIPRIDFRLRCAVTNTTPIAAFRGAGRPEAAALVERAVDLLAGELGLDPVAVRRRNLVPADAFPHTTPSGAVYDSGDYEGALDEALRIADYPALRREQAQRRAEGSRLLLGVGLSTYVEVTGRVSAEFGAVSVGPDGTVTVRTGVSPHGQGHETAFGQVVAALLRVPLASVQVLHSDTGAVPRGRGTMGSRSLQIGGSAALRAGQAVLDKARRIVAHLREAAVADVAVSDDGRVGVRGSPESALSWAELAAVADDPEQLPDGMEPGLSAEEVFDQGAGTFPFGTHLSVVDVDAETGFVRLRRHIAVDDAGRVLNPMLADGQVHGGLAQGIAQALYEEVPYDEHGNPQAANLVGYLVPTAPDLPAFETARPQTPTPLNPLGAKGIGEAATIGSTPAVQNAVIDALSHLGVRHLDMPLTPERVWRAIQDAQA